MTSKDTHGSKDETHYDRAPLEETQSKAKPSIMADNNIEFTTVTDLDPNVWYHVTEERVDSYDRDFSSNLHLNLAGDLQVQTMQRSQMWQFHPVDAARGRYSARLSQLGPWRQLGVCRNPDERSAGQTQPCMLDSDARAEEQMWDVASWGSNGTFRFINVRNGSDYWLDVHQGNPPFMSDRTDLEEYHPAQRWLMTSRSNVNDETYSTVFQAVSQTIATTVKRL